jgi:D-serine deaminase-like pyridoxal phosphate-dependent protein
MRVDGRRLAALRQDRVDWRYRGFPAVEPPPTVAELGRSGWNILDGTLPTPLVVLHRSALDWNARRIADFCTEHGVALAPHAKTTMSPQLWDLQLARGAWGLTAATPAQVRVLHAFGVPRILLANEVADPAELRWLSRVDDARILCYVDGEAGVDLAHAAAEAPLDVLVEVGYEGGRGGCRTVEQADRVARAVAASPRLRLAGVAAFEGTVRGGRSPEAIARVRRLLDRAGETFDHLSGAGLIEVEPAVLTAGGSGTSTRWPGF